MSQPNIFKKQFAVATAAALLLAASAVAQTDEVVRWNRIATDAAAAAHATLIELMPAAKSQFDAAFEEALHAIQNGKTKASGLEVGRKAAAAILAARENGASRVLAGIHFSTAVNTGYLQGVQIGGWVFEKGEIESYLGALPQAFIGRPFGASASSKLLA
jgi:hypothetical protein